VFGWSTPEAEPHLGRGHHQREEHDIEHPTIWSVEDIATHNNFRYRQTLGANRLAINTSQFTLKGSLPEVLDATRRE
jgi:hypothetical protein